MKCSGTGLALTMVRRGDKSESPKTGITREEEKELYEIVS
jgi:hypothetical protein